MIRLQLIALVLSMGYLTAQGQCTVSKDPNGQVVTVCDLYATPGNTGITASHKEVTYRGSPYLGFPVWQRSTIRVDTSGKEISCELAYDLIENNVMCRFTGETKVSTLTPYSFTVDGIMFTRQLNTILGVDYHLYSTTLHDGETKLLKSLTRRLVLGGVSNGYEKGNKFDGYYQTTQTYYIRKGDARPELIELSRTSVVNTLYEQSEKIAARLPDNQLTINDVSHALQLYDSLMAVAKINKPPLSFEPVFNQLLHDQIIYPSQAWTGSVYGRVYVGFDISESGLVKNITTLSPQNIGFGFDYAVRQGLEKLFRVKPVYKGRYALPVAFTFTNSKEKSGPHVPMNTLPSERFDGRTVLEEFIVPIVISKPVNDTREVWGYYK